MLLKQLASLFRSMWKQWPFSQTKAESFDTLQRKLTRWTFPEPWKDGEEFFSFKGRESTKVREMCEATGWWSRAWAKTVIADAGHLHRGNDKGLWAPHLLIEGERFVNVGRQMVVRTVGTMLETRLGTRRLQGTPRIRMWQGHRAAKAWVGEEEPGGLLQWAAGVVT